MAFVTPDEFIILGDANDRLGSAEIAQALPIGGAVNEAEILLENGHFVHAQVARSTGGLCTWGEAGSPQNPFASTTSATYTDLARMRMVLGEGRDDVTILLDFDDGRIRVGIYDAATFTLIGSKVESTDSASRTVEEINYTGLTATDIVVVFEGKRNTTELDLYCARVIEDTGDLSDGATFKKMDSDAAAPDEPLDGYLLHGIDTNTEAAYTAQNRKWFTLWPDAEAPVVAAHTNVCYPLGVLRVGPDDSEVTYPMWHDVSDAAVNFALAAVDLTTGEYIKGDETQVAIGTNNATDLALDVSSRRGRPLKFYLVVRSEDSGTSTTQAVTYTIGSPANLITARHLVSGLSSITFTSGKRWKIDVSDPSGSYIPDGRDFPETRTVVYQTGNDVNVWPLYDDDDKGVEPGPQWIYGNHTWTVTEIGQSTIYSAGLYISNVRTRGSVKSLLRPGMAPSALAVGKLYARQRRLFKERTRYHGGLGYDPSQKTGSDIRLLWGGQATYYTTWRDMAACMVSHDLPSLKPNGDTGHRHVLDVDLVFLIVSANRPGRERLVDLDVRASLQSFGAGSWASSVDTSSTRSLKRLPSTGSFHEGTLDTADLVKYANSRGRNVYHYLRGAASEIELRSRAVPFVYTALSIDDSSASDPLVDESQRLLRIEVKGKTEDSDGSNINIERDRYQVVLMAWGARTREVVAGS